MDLGRGLPVQVTGRATEKPSAKVTVGLCAGWTGLNWDIRSCAGLRQEG